MKCPPGMKPWRHDLKTGDPMPLFVPAELLGHYRTKMPGTWVEVMPDPMPYNRAITPDDLKRDG